MKKNSSHINHKWRFLAVILSIVIMAGVFPGTAVKIIAAEPEESETVEYADMDSAEESSTDEEKYDDSDESPDADEENVDGQAESFAKDEEYADDEEAYTDDETDDDLKEDTGISFSDSRYNFTLGENDDYIQIGLEAPNGVLSCTSSDASVVKVIYEGWDCVEIGLEGCGSATLTATDYKGNQAKCTVNVAAPELLLSETAASVSVSKGYHYIDIVSGYDLSFVSSNTDIVEVDYEEYYDSFFSLILHKPGTAVITVTDCAGNTVTLNVTVTDAEWSLNKTTITSRFSEGYEVLNIITDDYWDNTYTWTSSDEKIAIVDGEGEQGYIEFKGVGTCKITATDKYGKKETCTLTINPDPISFGSNKKVTFSSYGGYYDYSDTEFRFSTKGDNYIVSASSSDAKIVKVKRVVDKSDDYIDAYIQLIPKGAGTAVITATDQYGQTAQMTVTVTQKYLDESKYLEDLKEAYIWTDVVYGTTSIGCSCQISASVYTTINGTKYTGKVNEDGDYIIKIPKLAAGKKITVVFQKGQAKSTSTVTVKQKFGGNLKATAKSQTYTGKALTPAVTVVYGKTTLKKGTDFTVKYTSNKAVGTGKATLTFKGNYKGSKAVYFSILPKGTTVSKLTPSAKAITVKWKKQAVQTNGYQIQCSTSKTFSSGNKTITIAKSSSVSRKITGLKAKKTYYIRIRTYKKTGGKTYYSAWSSAKNLKTK